MKIKELREKTGMTQSEFAKRFGIPLRTIQNWERGQSEPRSYVISLIIEILDCEKLIALSELKSDA